MNSRLAGILLVIVCSLLWSLGGLGIKSVNAPALTVAGLRSFFAIPALLLFSKIVLSRQASARSLFSVAPLTGGIGIVSYACTLILFVSANKLTTAANSIFLQYTAPAYVLVLSWLVLRERARWIDFAAILGYGCGMILFFRGQLSSDSIIGSSLALLSGLSFASTTLALRALALRPIAVREVEVLQISTVTLGNALVFIICLPYIIRHPPTNLWSWLVLAAMGSLQIGLPYALYALGVARVTALEAALLCVLEPILNPFWVAVGSGEIPSSNSLLGGGLILLTLIIHSVAKWYLSQKNSKNFRAKYAGT